MSADPLDKRYSGKVLYFRILGYVKYYWPALVLGIFGNAMYSGVDAGMTYLLKPILNKGFIARDYVFIQWLPIIVITIFVLRAIANFLGSYYMSYVARSIVMRFRIQIFDHLLKIPATYYDNSSSGQILSVIIYNVEQVAKVSASALTDLVQSLFLIIGLLVVMFSISWQLSLLYFVTIPVIAIIVKLSSRYVRKISHGIQRGMGEVTSIAEEAIEGYKVVRAFGGEKYESDKFSKAIRDNRRRELKNVILKTISVSGVQLVAACALSVIVYLATSKTSLSLTAGGFVTLVASMLAILKPLKTFTTVNATIQRGLAGAQSVFALLDDDLEKDTGVTTLDTVKGKIEYRDVLFTYPKTEKQVLKDICFTVEPGKTMALVGRSGSGKSTIVNLLSRFYDYEQGDILIDGLSVKSLTLSNLRSHIAYVSQNITLFNDTIARNIAYGQTRGASDEDIINAAKAAHAWAFIENLPNGLDTLIGEDGVLLSGGQRQRLAIARAILKNAPILIMDEATSSLDTEAERHIQAAMENLMQDRTSIVIAHRLSTIENADKIIVMHDGALVEAGTHAELIAKAGHYAKLHSLQFNTVMN
jgi:ATP-binding cassette, subfamily B, bacterial MsbA